jgi:hypothetical protein
MANIELTITAPLVLVVIVELSAIAREANSSDFEALYDESPFPNRVSELISRFTMIHYLNSVLLMSTASIVLIVSNLNTSDQATVDLTIGVFIIIFWAFLPIMEVRDYDKVFSRGEFPNSLFFHIVTTLAIGFILFAVLANAIFGFPKGSIGLLNILFVAVIGAFIIITQTGLFVILLTKEFNELLRK